MATVDVYTDTPTAAMLVDIAFDNTSVTACKVERKGGGQGWVTLAGGAAFALKTGAGMFVDFEAPFDRTDLTYRVSQVTPTGSETGTSSWVTLDSDGHTWLKDPAYPPRNIRLDEVTSLVEQTYAARAGVFTIIDRPHPVVVAARRAGWSGELVFHTATDDQRTSVNDLLSRGQVLLLSTPERPWEPYGLGNIYVHVGDVTCSRVTSLVTEQTRRWTLPLTAVDRPAALATMPPGFRWVDVKNTWATWQALADTGMTWNQLLEYKP